MSDCVGIFFRAYSYYDFREENLIQSEMEIKPVISVSKVSKRFDTKTVLNDVSFSLNEKNSFVALLGRSGCGKTTLLRLLAGLLTPDDGIIYLNGEVVSQNGRLLVPPHKRKIGFIFQDLALFPHFTVFENIAFGLKANKMAEYKNKTSVMMERLNIVSLAKNYPNELSGGQQQLVALARTMVLDPGIILMDEPLTNLDVKVKRSIISILLELREERARTFIIVTHDHTDAFNLADKIILLDNGKIVDDGTPREIRNSNVEFTRDFIELDQTNISIGSAPTY